jgi:hypothetical protein
LAATIGVDPEERALVERILNSGQDRQLLKLLRDETTLLVLMVRVANQERREAWAAENSEPGEGGEVRLALFDDLED